MTPSLRALALLLTLLLGIKGSLPAPSPAPSAKIYSDTLSGVGWVQSADRARGTGWVVDHNRRWLITCYHVVGDNDHAEVFFPFREDGKTVSEKAFYLEHRSRLEKDGLVVRGKVIRRNQGADLALVELSSLPPGVVGLPLAGTRAQPGDRVQMVGNRYDLGVLWASGAGTVRAVQEFGKGYFSAGKELAKGAPVILASAPINEGDSGGPLVNTRGEVVGVSAAVSWEAGGSGLFIDVKAVRALLGAEGEKGAPRRAHLCQCRFSGAAGPLRGRRESGRRPHRPSQSAGADNRVGGA